MKGLRYARTLGVAGLLVGATMAPQAIGATQASDVAVNAAHEAYPSTRRANGEEIARLVLKTDAGKAVGGAVVATLWPSLEARSSMQLGDSFRPTPIDIVHLSDGSASVRAGNREVMAAHTSEDGLLLVHLEIFTNEGHTSLVLERGRAEHGGWVASSEARTAAGLARPVAITLDSKTLKPLPSTDGGTAEAPVLRHHNSTIWCSDIYVGDDYNGSVQRTETIATSAATNGVKVNVTYASGANTTSGFGWNVGAKGTAFGATWQQTSTVTRSSTVSATYETVTGATGSWTNREWRVTREYKKWSRHCPISGTPDYYTERWIEPAGVGGFPAIINSRYPLPQCQSQWDLTSAVSVATENATATTYLSAFSVSWGTHNGASIAFNGSAQSGYNSKVKVKFTRPAAGYWYWCGNTFNPVDSAKARAGR